MHKMETLMTRSGGMTKSTTLVVLSTPMEISTRESTERIRGMALACFSRRPRNIFSLGTGQTISEVVNLSSLNTGRAGLLNATLKRIHRTGLESK